MNMKRPNVSRGYAALICATLLAPGSPAAAFDAPARIQRNLNLNSQCGLTAFVHNVDGGLASARVRALSAGSTQTQAAGGASYFNGATSNIFSAVTAANLQANCSLADVTNLVQQGAAGAYAAATSISLTFDARRTSNGDLYAYRAEISGAVATTVTVSQTLVNAAPTITLGTPSGPDGSGNYTVVATLSENSTDFTAASLTLTNATATMSGSGSSYTIVLTPVTDGAVNASVQKGAFTDSGGLGNWFASNTLSFSNTVEKTQKVIAQFMQTRANQLISSQPDLTGFLSGSDTGALNMTVTQGGGAFGFASAPDKGNGVWARLNGSWTNESDRKTAYAFGVIGSHVNLSPDLLVGGMIEFDFLGQKEGATRVDGHGWLIGPYFVARSPAHPLFFEGRFLYGQTKNDISPLGTYSDSFETQRLLTQFKVTGEIAQGRTTWMPSVQLSYTTDTQRAYTDGLGNLIPEQGFELTQAELGLDVRHEVLLPRSRGRLELTGGLSFVGSSTKGSGYASLVVPEYAGGRGKVKAGANYTLPNGAVLVMDVYNDGIGAAGYESYGAQFGFNLMF